MENVNLKDWLTLAIGVIGLITAWVSQSNRLPKEARNYIARIGGERINQIISATAEMVTASPAQRQMRAVELLQDTAERRLGIRLPTSIANLIVEWAYQQYRRRTGH